MFELLGLKLNTRRTNGNKYILLFNDQRQTETTTQYELMSALKQLFSKNCKPTFKSVSVSKLQRFCYATVFYFVTVPYIKRMEKYLEFFIISVL